MILSLTHKQLLELKFWLQLSDFDAMQERAKLDGYLRVFGLAMARQDQFSTARQDQFSAGSILEVGTGPWWGLLPHIRADKKTGVDPLYPAFDAVSVLADRDGIQAVGEPFEHWETNEQFDAIFTTNALDHGEMGFYLIPKMWRLLKPGGRLFLHVHLRPKDLLNLVHDHSLTEAQLDQHLSYTDLIEERRRIYGRDVDGEFCEALVGVWRKPQ